jgi:twinkle protein
MLTAFDRLEELQAIHAGTTTPASETGWPSLDRHYKVLSGQWTLVHGIPGHGKSTFLDALAVNLAKGPDHWFFCFFSPETFPVERHMVKIAEKWTGRPFRGLTPQTLKATTEMLEANFAWLDPAPVEGITKNLGWIMNAVREFEGNIGTDRNIALVIDPWNEIEHFRVAHMTETEYISLALSGLREWAKSMDVHVFVVAHPQKLLRNKDGVRPVPTPYDISGSSNWYNKADNILCVWRDVMDKRDLVEIHVQKIRFEDIGRPGQIELKYNRAIGTFDELVPR